MPITNIGQQKVGKKNSSKAGQSALLGKKNNIHSTLNTQSNFRDELKVQASPVGGEIVEIFLANGEIDQEALTAMQDNIHTLGDQLIAKPGYNTVVAYRNAVQTLLKSIHPYLHEKESFLAPKKVGHEMRHRRFTLVNQVNKKLDVVLKLVLSSQADQMKIMNALNEIKGLLINILQ